MVALVVLLGNNGVPIVPKLSKIEIKCLMLELVIILATSMIIASCQIYAQPLSLSVGAASDIQVRTSPRAIAVNPNTNMIYVANSRSDSVSDKWDKWHSIG